MYGGYGHPHGRGCGCGLGYGVRGGGSGIRLRQRYRDCFYYSQPGVSPDIQREALEAEKAQLKNRLDFITEALDNIPKPDTSEGETSE